MRLQTGPPYHLLPHSAKAAASGKAKPCGFKKSFPPQRIAAALGLRRRQLSPESRFAQEFGPASKLTLSDELGRLLAVFGDVLERQRIRLDLAPARDDRRRLEPWGTPDYRCWRLRRSSAPLRTTGYSISLVALALLGACLVSAAPAMLMCVPRSWAFRDRGLMAAAHCFCFRVLLVRHHQAM